MTEPKGLDAVLIQMGTLFTNVGELQTGHRDLEERSGKTTRILETIKGNLDGIRTTLDSQVDVLAQLQRCHPGRGVGPHVILVLGPGAGAQPGARSP